LFITVHKITATDNTLGKIKSPVGVDQNWTTPQVFQMIEIMTLEGCGWFQEDISFLETFNSFEFTRCVSKYLINDEW